MLTSTVDAGVSQAQVLDDPTVLRSQGLCSLSNYDTYYFTNYLIIYIRWWISVLSTKDKRWPTEAERALEEKKKKIENEAYRRVTRLSLSQVTWNQVHGSTKVGSQLCRTSPGSFTALLNAYRASPVHVVNRLNIQGNHKTINYKERKKENLVTFFVCISGC